MIKRIGTYIVTMLFTLCSVFFVIPELHFNLDGLTSITKTLKEIETKSHKYTAKNWFSRGNGNGKRLEYREQTAYTTVYKMTDNSEYNVTGHHPKYNGIILSKENIGKTIKIYTEKDGAIPLQLEIDSKVVFGLNETNQTSYIILAFTLGLIIYSFFLWTRVTEQ